MNHIGNANKKVSDTPRTDDQIGHDGSTMSAIRIEFCRKLERELNAAHESLLFARGIHIQKQIALDKANHRIKQLEETDDAALTYSIGLDLQKENDALKDRIKRLEESGDDAIHEAAHGREHDALEIWNKAKEDKL